MDKKRSLVDRAFVHRVFVRVLLGPSLKRSTFPDSTSRYTLCFIHSMNRLLIRLWFLAALTVLGPPVFAFYQQVKDAQVLLNSLGFNAGPEDGLDGEKTNSALIEFYSSQQKTFDGELSENELVDLMNFIDAKALKNKNKTAIYKEPTNDNDVFGIILFLGLTVVLITVLRKKKHKPNTNFTPQSITRKFSRNPNNSPKLKTNETEKFPAITGKCHVVDGDTIHIGKHKIRLAGINAPELDEPYGQQAKWALVKLCKGKIITAYPDGEKSYERIVATCFLDDGSDLAAEMVKMELALDIPMFPNADYRHLETPNSRRKLTWKL